ncbi:MAG: translation initiation factor [Dehalococcoidia bacterium]
MTSPGRGGNSRLVYSTDGGRVAPPKNGPPKGSGGPTPPPADGIVRVSREKKGRGGKTVSLVVGLPPNPDELERVLKVLKTKLGSGGTAEGPTLVIQGDHRERIVAELQTLGYKAKSAGG